MVHDMSTSSQSQASAAYDVSNAADGILLYKQQQQQYAISSVPERFRPYLVPYGRDNNVALSPTPADHDLNRAIVQQQQQQQQQVLPDNHYGPGMTDVNPGTRSPGHHHHICGGGGLGMTRSPRRLREFIPAHKKDSEYWMKRQKNNEAAKRSRDKRRVNDVVMTKKIVELTGENRRLRLELETIKRKYGLLSSPGDVVQLSANDELNGGNHRPPSPSLLCVGISSSDDSAPLSSSSSSFPVVVGHSSSPSPPPILDRCYNNAEPPLAQHHPDVKSSLPSLIPLTSQHYQTVESYRSVPVVPGQHMAVQNNMNMSRQLFQRSVRPSRNLRDPEETVIAMVSYQQPHITTSTLTTAKVGYLRLENVEDPVFSTGGTHQVRSSCLAEERYLPSRTISLTPAANNAGLEQGYFQPPRQVTISNSNVPFLTFSYLSSDDDGYDDTKYGQTLSNHEVPLNLTTRSLSWHQPPTTKYLLSDSRCGGAMMREQAATSLDNNCQSVRNASYGLSDLPNHESWTGNSKDSMEMENYTEPSARALQRGQECLRGDSGVKTTPLFRRQSPLSMLNARTIADSTVILEDVTCSASYPSVASRRQKVYGNNTCSYEGGGRYASSDLAAGDDDDDVDDNVAQNSSRQVRGGVPLKVWHKRSLQNAAAASGRDQVKKKRRKKKKQVFQETGATTSASIGLAHDDPGGRLVVDASPDSSPSNESVVNYSSESSESDANTAATPDQQNYNNNYTAARKCNGKKRLTDLSLTAATILESENNKLKEELRCLSREVTDLKEIIGRKETDSRNGNSVLASK